MQKGFSLVELSIVLVIVGLLAGGILVGRSLISASEVRAVYTDADRYKTAIYAFRDQFGALPGDMPNAVKYWGTCAACGTADGVDAVCRALTTAAGTTTETCNGDGDGYFTGSNGTQMHEQYRAWQHLANAGMISGNYTGYSPTACCGNGVAGVNLPAGKMSQTAYGLRAYTTQLSSSTNYFPGEYGNVMWFGIPLAGSGSNRSASIKPEDAWTIDTKVDDGKPATGAWVVPEVLSTCHTNTDPALSAYALSYTDIACAFMIKMGAS